MDSLRNLIIENLVKNNSIVDGNFKKIVHEIVEKKNLKKGLGSAGEQPREGENKGDSV